MSKLKEVRALAQYADLGNRIASSRFSDLLTKGYMQFPKIVNKETCFLAHESTKSDFNKNLEKYDKETLLNIAEFGCVRSPFIWSNVFRDLMLEPLVQTICKTFFPCGHILHLNRSIIDSHQLCCAPSPAELHRDIPYLFTPTNFPLSLSFLFFFSESESSQLAILPDSHDTLFFSENRSLVPINTSVGSLLVFNSSLMHCSLPSKEDVSYSLYMFSSPIVKQVVDYSSAEALAQITRNKYRLTEINQLLGFNYLVPKDDDKLINRKISRVAANKEFYKGTSG